MIKLTPTTLYGLKEDAKKLINVMSFLGHTHEVVYDAEGALIYECRRFESPTLAFEVEEYVQAKEWNNGLHIFLAIRSVNEDFCIEWPELEIDALVGR